MSFSGYYRQGIQQGGSEHEIGLSTGTRKVKKSYMMLEDGAAKDPRIRPSRLSMVLIMVLIYTIAVGWHLIHPFVSVFTGDFKGPRKTYVDESSIEPGYLRLKQSYPMPHLSKKKPTKLSMCEAIDPTHHIDCRIHENKVEIATIIPTATGIAPVAEAIVLVVPNTLSWHHTGLHLMLTVLINRLSSPQYAPWLAKTLIIATPVYRDPGYTLTLHETTEYLLKHSMGPFEDSMLNSTRITSAMIRNLIVVDTQQDSSAQSEIRILPQGQRGILPNMDLVATSQKAYAITSSFHRMGRISVHPHRSRVDELEAMITTKFPQLRKWAKPLFDLLAFEYTMALGPKFAHTAALERGIDALTLQLAKQDPDAADKDALEFIQALEIIIRSLSNLHERLHHSTSLYLLSSPTTFVKHEEYLVPTILLLIPCAIRLFTLIFADIDRFDWAAVDVAVWTVLFSTLLSTVAVPAMEWMVLTWHWTFPDPIAAIQIASLLAYLPVLYVAFTAKSLTHSREFVNMKSSIHAVACLLCVYTNVSLAFGHVSLAFPSSLFWSTLIALPSFTGTTHRRLRGIMFVAGLPVLHCRTISLFGGNCSYLQYVCLPLNLLMCLLWSLEIPV